MCHNTSPARALLQYQLLRRHLPAQASITSIMIYQIFVRTQSHCTRRPGSLQAAQKHKQPKCACGRESESHADD